MVNSEERKIGDVDPSDEIMDAEDPIDVSSSGDVASGIANRSVTRRLTEIFVEDGDGDLLLQRSDREDGVLQWLGALDMQVMGACRVDERLKPLLKLNTSTDVAEDPLLAHLSQHFEPAEVGMLARCLCIPLVSVRVGKINKQGTLFFPTSIRGNLCLTLLPTSNLRISFNADDGSTERLATLSTEVQCNDIEIEEISADKSGRSFFIKTSDGVVSYFWCSEKSKLLGTELLRKMQDLLIKKPSLAELTGICDSRLKCFATHFRAYLTGSVLTTGILSATPSDDSIDSPEIHFPHSSSSCQKISHFQQLGAQANLVSQGCCPSPGLSPPIATAASEKFRSTSERFDTSFTSSDNADPSGLNICQKDRLPEVNGTHSLALLNFLDALENSTELPLAAGQPTKLPLSGPSPFSPQYCWCPPMQPTIESSQLSFSSSSEPSSLPPLSILLTSKPLLNLADIPPIEFPALAPEPLVRLPTSQQIPTFTPLICDPIVHIPVIDVCSSGQGYLVSGGTAMSTVIPPLNTGVAVSINIVDPLMPKSAESAVEKSARETLRMLISSNQSNPPLLEVKENVLVAGSRALYSGTVDVDAMSTMEFVLSSDGGGKRFGRIENLMDQKDNQHYPGNTDTSGLDE